MLFSSLVFLWCFLPLTLIGYWLMPNVRWKNGLLLLASLVFYSWGEPLYILLMLLVVTVDYLVALLIPRWGGWILALGITANLLSLGYFKYFGFLQHIVNSVLHRDALAFPEVALPLGISFYTFQAMSYMIDVYRGQTKPQKNYFRLLLYVSLFPQLVAGPIVRYKDVEAEIAGRSVSSEDCIYGLRRFCFGLAKKVILSNTLAYYADQIMDSDYHSLSSGVLWLGAILYTMQIYYDFSGYSDMAIGLGRIFGFHFLENFNYPYVSSSVREFWRRWHISLSTWFREYVYIPLGGNRKGRVRTYVNLGIVFFLTGLWHGASFAFVFWGLYHGFFMILERLFLGKWLEKNPWKWVNHLYTLVVVICGWVFFRIDRITHGLKYVWRMLTFQQGDLGLVDFLSLKMLVTLAIAILLMGFIQEKKRAWRDALYSEKTESVLLNAVAIFGLCYSILLLVSNAYNPFIYFRF